MSIISNLKHQRPLKSIWSAFLVLVVVFGLFNGFLVKTALATNNYIDNIAWYKDNNGYYRFKFHVKTTFTETVGAVSYHVNGSYLCPISQGYFGALNGTNFNFIPILGNNNTPYFPISSCGQTITFTAGNTYDTYLSISSSIYVNENTYLLCVKSGNCSAYNVGFENWHGSPADNTDYATNLGGSGGSYGFTDTQKYYFIQYPSMTITYPSNNAEIANIFDIQGSFTQPAQNPSSFLQADIMPTGTWISSFQSFWTAIGGATSGNFSITIGNVPSGYYDFRIYFRSGNFDGYQGALISNIHIVNDLPPFIPPWEEQPPTTAPIVYQPLEPIDYYTTQQSTYATATPLYIALTGTFSPVLLSITSNLQQFASNFTLTNASSTGNQIGQSVLLVRSYVSNINSFFGNFPVSQFLLLYLIALVVVIVLRLVKALINLFKL